MQHARNYANKPASNTPTNEGDSAGVTEELVVDGSETGSEEGEEENYQIQNTPQNQEQAHDQHVIPRAFHVSFHGVFVSGPRFYNVSLFEGVATSEHGGCVFVIGSIAVSFVLSRWVSPWFSIYFNHFITETWINISSTLITTVATYFKFLLQ